VSDDRPTVPKATEPEMFRCIVCGREAPWSEGADDRLPSTCDDCAAAAVVWVEAVCMADVS